MQGGSVDMWKENIIEDLKKGLLNYEVVRKFLTDLKFSDRDDEILKVAELKKVE